MPTQTTMATQTYLSPRNSTDAFIITFLKNLALVLLGLVLGHFHGLWHSLYCFDEQNDVASLSFSTSAPIGDNGWTTIQVFRGVSAARPNDSVWHSQAHQDELVFSLLRNKTDGYFVDLAANDATQLSNTYSLERDWGWKGVCIEPNPIYWQNLTAFRSCTKIAAVVGNKRLEGPYRTMCAWSRYFIIKS
jgi:hypothetical protein